MKRFLIIISVLYLAVIHIFSQEKEQNKNHTDSPVTDLEISYSESSLESLMNEAELIRVDYYNVGKFQGLKLYAVIITDINNNSINGGLKIEYANFIFKSDLYLDETELRHCINFFTNIVPQYINDNPYTEYTHLRYRIRNSIDFVIYKYQNSKKWVAFIKLVYNSSFWDNEILSDRVNISIKSLDDLNFSLGYALDIIEGCKQTKN